MCAIDGYDLANVSSTENACAGLLTKSGHAANKEWSCATPSDSVHDGGSTVFARSAWRLDAIAAFWHDRRKAHRQLS